VAAIANKQLEDIAVGGGDLRQLVASRIATSLNLMLYVSTYVG
jgi:hypothetical protein